MQLAREHFCYIKTGIWSLKLLFYGLSDLVITNTRENFKGQCIVLVSISAIGLRTVVCHQLSFPFSLSLRKRKKMDSLTLRKLQRQMKLQRRSFYMPLCTCFCLYFS